MVDELASALCQQTLHGYGEGHRLLAGSASLPARDVRTMLVFSDAAGGGTLPAEGYLTGYPLIEAAKYVVARTWPAPEMPRPGCVWTHSILIDFSDLAALRSASSILSSFRRPGTKERESYGRDLLLPGSSPSVHAMSETSAGAGLIDAVYGHPMQKIVAGLDAGFDEDLVVRLWMQQWPRLRRSFRFCTFTSSDRSTPSDMFDVQLVSSASRIPRMRILDAVVPSQEVVDPDFAPVVDDLMNADARGLRHFLRVSGGEIAGGRGAMRPLSRIFNFVQGQSSLTSISDAVAALDEIGPSQAVTARKSIVERLVQDIESIDDTSFELVLNEARSNGTNVVIAQKTSEELWRRQPSVFARALSTEDHLTQAAEAKLASMDDEALLAGINREPSVAPVIADRRQDLLVNPKFWSIPGLNLEQALSTSSSADGAPAIVASMIAGGVDRADDFIRKFGAGPVIEAIERVADGVEQSKLEAWLRALGSRRDELNHALSAGRVSFKPLLLLVARVTYPDAVRSAGGMDPWLEAFTRARGSLNREDEDYLKAFLLARALGWQSCAQAALIKVSFEAVYRALADGRLPSAGWSLLYHELPWVAPWNEWDRCWRVRQAVIDRFVDRELDPREFANVVDEPKIWLELAASMAKTWRGSKYLERVRDRLQFSTSHLEQHRIAEIHRLLL